MSYLDSRDKPFSDDEFAAIPRNSDGDIIDLYDAYAFITDEQRKQLSGDDESRMEDYDEEMRVMVAMAMGGLGA